MVVNTQTDEEAQIINSPACNVMNFCLMELIGPKVVFYNYSLHYCSKWYLNLWICLYYCYWYCQIHVEIVCEFQLFFSCWGLIVLMMWNERLGVGLFPFVLLTYTEIPNPCYVGNVCAQQCVNRKRVSQGSSNKSTPFTWREWNPILYNEVFAE